MASATSLLRGGNLNAVSWRSLIPGTDIGLAVGVLLLLSILIVPLPTFILDMGLSLSITASALVLMVSLFLAKPVEFTSFPTLLLLTTLLRLALEIATTRLILSHGNEGAYAAGHVVAAFGGFLMGGDVVIGGIVFCILLVVNFMVITKGSGRIAEVAARFFLDAMPGKQMAIDAELASGAINDRTARLKRKELEEESSFYGAMDGAAKFVRGDAIAAIIITGINIVGGLAIGVLRHGMPVNEAANTFTTLTVGDGLVSQIPALLVSTAAGIVVTKGGTDGSADVTLVRQLGGNPKPMAMAAVLSACFALLPGLPAFPFLTIAALAGAGAWFRHKTPTTDSDGDITETAPTPATTPISDVLKLDLLRLELGFGLLPLTSGDNSQLTEQIKALRRAIATEMGFVTPPIRIQDNILLPSEKYVIKLKEIEIGSGEAKPGKLMAMSPSGGTPPLAGDKAIEPAFGLPAVWIDPSLKTKAIALKCTVVDPASVIVTHLSELVRQNLPDLLTYVATQSLLDDLPREQQKLVNDLIPSQVTLSTVQRVLQSLLAERISIRDLPTILESIQEGSGLGLRGIQNLTSHVRVRLSRQICSTLEGPGGYIPMVTLSPEWEAEFINHITGQGEERRLAMPPSLLNRFVTRLRDVFNTLSSSGEVPVIVVSTPVRDSMRSIVERVRPNVSVLSQSEIYPRARIKTIATIT
ncbi:flagellar biosynthesis protein FlhA [Gluconacetobacter sp. 1b LMG 1731]|uniref:Flagellar biosynthesis protein FlhA n=1 Tax=Gluconacetobacter dulcium TaxID=2729096 RepID=A0A7W4NTD6_9PROT|nr:flagellar biosynthesis protein FlhA [Gluconacetobacter dulcium]MBB2163048.1 flagellar biosynthesis protein FlhA [Gluconacetobacter dulcium]MBB2192257.1 flagellar biosynthesis protein FlhA [Gluconacetobacter dulcium]